MTKDNIVKCVSTTTHGVLYHVFDKNTGKKLYTGEISDNPKHRYCECTGWSILERCYHNTQAQLIMEVKIV